MALSVMKTVEDEPTIHLSEYYYLLIRHKWVIIISLVVMCGLVLRYNSRLVPIYRATATLIIDKETTQSPITGQRMDYETYLSESLTFNTHFELITSRTVLEQLVKDLKLDQVDKKLTKKDLVEINPIKQFLSGFKKNILLLLNRKKELPPPVDRRASIAQALKGMVNIENIEETRLLKINVSSLSPIMARDIANGLANAYINFNISNRMKSSKDTLSWLTDRLYEMKKGLENAEEEFLAYKQSVKLISVEGKQRIISQKITDFNDAYLQARNKRLELDSKLEQLQRISQSGKDIPLLHSLIGNKLINDLHNQVVKADLELSGIAKVYKSKHPKIIQIKSHIKQTRIKLNQEVKKELDNLNAERAVLLSREQVLQKTIADFEKEGMEINKNELKHSILKRNVEMNQNLYNSLLSRVKEADITGDINVSNIRITEEAQSPTSPVSPNKKRNLLLGVVLGLMIGIGISFFWEYLDRSLRTEEDVQKYLGLPVLAVIPVAKNGKQRVYEHSSDGSKLKAEEKNESKK
jgi:uncharacterized protein involved in exopolysaccharide biosynthesis